ncbi:hypothetical protein E2C01_052318 [Portunus trituberculatus]|uniref:Uncharacterized protein n=1 Tax=Portunus trituberculatus TaxID=210409 RepID=A0A5B7GDD0_PORTR|nr:hypothetical protein [Portunus trituberculatus]
MLSHVFLQFYENNSLRQGSLKTASPRVVITSGRSPAVCCPCSSASCSQGQKSYECNVREGKNTEENIIKQECMGDKPDTVTHENILKNC